jgi:hypothetical protein
MLTRKIDLKEFLSDLRCGSSPQYLMNKFNLDAKKIEEVCRLLNQPEFTAALELWESGKLTDSQFTRAFSEVKGALDGDS